MASYNVHFSILFFFTKQTVFIAVSYTHLRAHETKANLVCRLLLEKKKYFRGLIKVKCRHAQNTNTIDILCNFRSEIDQ